ncbi:MAG: hypothetical protein KBF30_08630 [Hyphomonadaceae bacterium]|nr:hypothetical protein [Hyphomonadaceae bacterium]
MALFKFDHKTEPMASGASFAGRMFTNLLAALIIVALALAVGMYGYQEIEGMAWIDAFLNSAMLLGGMGPVAPELHTEAGKLFAGFYALGCGLVLVLVSGIILAPVLHRILHALHVNDDDKS